MLHTFTRDCYNIVYYSVRYGDITVLFYLGQWGVCKKLIERV